MSGSMTNQQTLPEEYDEESRPVTIYLFVRPVAQPLVREEVFHHALVFHFIVDNDFRTVEGMKGKDGKISPRYRKTLPEEEDEKCGTYYKIGYEIISPKRIRELTVKNKWNGRDYKPATNTCQEWVTGLVENLRLDVQQELRKYPKLPETDLLAKLNFSGEENAAAKNGGSGSSFCRSS